MQQEIELEISINIKNRKYLIRVPKNADISMLVHQFLIDNQLNPKHQKAILQILEQKLFQAQEENSQKKTVLPAYNQDKSNINLLSEPLDQHIEKPVEKASNQTVSYNKKKGLISKIQEQLQQNQREKVNKAPENRKVYEQWKLKEKERAKRQNKADKSCENSRLSNKKHTVSPDYFYKKGLKFKQQCEQNCENQFKKLYPFRLHDQEFTEKQQRTLFERLSKEKKDLKVREYLSRRAQEEENAKTVTKNDSIKQKVKQLDHQVDRALFEMIKNGELSLTKQRPLSRSPFRKTVLR